MDPVSRARALRLLPQSVQFALDGGDPPQAWLERVESFAASLARSAAMDEDRAHFLVLALHEALVNALRHGRGRDGSDWVRVTFRLEWGCLVMAIEDRGPGFDPGAVSDPLSDDGLLRSNGRGIFYMRCFVDRVGFESGPEGGTVVQLSKRLF